MDKKELTALVMSNITHPDSYYQNGLTTLNYDFRKMTQDQISIWKAMVKWSEAEAIVAFALDDVPEQMHERFQNFPKIFQPGDVVKEIGNPQKMTISEINEGNITCKWFDSEDNLHEGMFQPERIYKDSE